MKKINIKEIKNEEIWTGDIFTLDKELKPFARIGDNMVVVKPPELYKYIKTVGSAGVENKEYLNMIIAHESNMGLTAKVNVKLLRCEHINVKTYINQYDYSDFGTNTLEFSFNVKESTGKNIINAKTFTRKVCQDCGFTEIIKE